MRNKPKYNFLKNSKYALEGVFAALKQERAFQIEVFLAILMTIILWLLPIKIGYKFILQASLIIPFIAEMFNTAIENTVDLACKEIHPLAKYAKDTASAGVFFSLVLTGLIWLFTLLIAFNIV
ncbi:diacylglycerol kinase (ATP) [Thermotomaculum hydrothermale]|uniref:Diacylglycerol kinase n=1 Tax=Thermotomaculum hydrothermale TaxID=981385 RepID=A0A7R6PNK6_9BACT|nr:diacylglycerol kinase [Thermotomaculum hydrothermale]BBB32888.1 diacylglycerol kinase (ATP) [Thermotomaculum hydrothermale]